MSTGAQTDQATLLAALAGPGSGLAEGGPVEVLETHISTILLAGDHAYKIKKPVNLGFLDFTQLAQRRHYCEEELRLNRRLAPALYQEVVPITGSPEAPRLGGNGKTIEYAVKMARFPQEALFDRRLAEGRLSPEHIDQLADVIATFHGQADRALPPLDFGSPPSVWAPMAQNFSQLAEQLPPAMAREQRQWLEAWSRQQFSQLAPLLQRRWQEGWTRECHGDLHLGNIAQTEDGPLWIFDGIEFNAEFRWIDVISEIAFLAMDLEARDRPDYSHRLINRYLENTGDYAGLPLLAFYKVYRALVRAKVAALRAAQETSPAREDALATCCHYLDYARRAAAPASPRLIVMHGLSGTGKSWVSQQLLEKIGALRLRSDVERKRLQGLPALARSASGTGSGLYGAEATRATYGRLADLARQIVAAGYPVIIDAANLQGWQRQLFCQQAAAAGVPWTLLTCHAPPAVLESRIATRQATGNDASEADDSVLAYQQRTQEPLTAEERLDCIDLDTTRPLPDNLAPRLGRPA